jgi:hypothetical protein
MAVIFGNQQATGLFAKCTGDHLGFDTSESAYTYCCGLVLKCYELRTRQHKMLNINALRPLKHYLPRI